MPSNLSPLAAAGITAFAYESKDISIISERQELPNSSAMDFNISSNKIIQSKTGISFFHKTSGFALTAIFNPYYFIHLTNLHGFPLKYCGNDAGYSCGNDERWREKRAQ